MFHLPLQPGEDVLTQEKAEAQLPICDLTDDFDRMKLCKPLSQIQRQADGIPLPLVKRAVRRRMGAS
jgi:hypothetical protein